jgi:hypothetical protein
VSDASEGIGQPRTPARLAPFLAQWDYVADILLERLEGLTDDEYFWQPAPDVWTIRWIDGRAVSDSEVWAPVAAQTPPRTLAWSISHLGWGSLTRADYLVGEHRLTDDDIVWPMTAAEGVAFMRDGLAAWRTGLDQMTDADLDTVGRSAYPGGLDPTLPLIEIVWWVNKELVFHAGEIWLMRDLYAARTSGG